MRATCKNIRSLDDNVIETHSGADRGLDEGIASTGNLPYIPLAEVKKHNTAHDCWMVIHGRIYDIKPILSSHPGGSLILLKYAGTDATYQFDDIGHSMESLIYDMPPGSLKGFLAPEDNPKWQADDQKHQERQEDQDEGNEQSHNEKDSDCIMVAHDRSLDSLSILNKFYTLLLYVTIALCVSLLIYVRYRWYATGRNNATGIDNIAHHNARPSAPYSDSLEDIGIPAWAY